MYSLRARSGATGAIVVLLVGTAIGSLLTDGDAIPPLVCVIAPFIAAAFLNPRVTWLVSAITVVECGLLSYFASDYMGWSLVARVAVALLASMVAVIVASARELHETSLSQANADLLAAELVQAVVDSSQDPIYAKDFYGRYLLANQAAAELMGLESGPELVGLRDRDLVDAEVAARFEANDQDALAAGRVEFEDEVPGPDGEHRRLLIHKTVLRDAHGAVLGMAGVTKDITRRRVAQLDLERSELRFRSLVETSAAIVWEADVDGRFVAPQPRWQAYTGQAWEQHEGHGWLEAVHPSDRDQLAAHFGRDVAQTLEEYPARLWHEESGAYRRVIFRAVAVNDPVRSVPEWLGTVDDVNARLLAEGELSRVAEARAIVAEAAARTSQATDEDSVGDAVLAVLEERLPAHLGAVSLSTDSGPGATILTSRGAREWTGLQALSVDALLPSSEVIRSGSKIHFRDADTLLRSFPGARPIVDELGLDGPSIVVPLRAGPRLVGTLGVWFHSEIAPESEELAVLALDKLAPVLAADLVQAEMIKKGAEIASSFQRSMLELALDSDPRLAMSVYYQAGADQLEAGGDWYDVVTLTDGRVAMVVGDVVGSNLRAATVMGRLRGACRGLILAAGNPGEVLEYLDAVAATIDGARFATCVCIIIDPGTQSATYSSAGHLPMMTIDGRSEPQFLWDAQGPPLTVSHDGPRPVATVGFPVGTRLFMYTDGLVERRSEVLDVGLERLAQAAIEGRQAALANECDRVTKVLLDGATQQDDLAIVCAELISHSADAFDRTIDPDAKSLHRVRRDLDAWLTGHTVDDATIADVVLATAELLANAIEHSGAPVDGIALRARMLGKHDLEVAVQDRGSWIEPPDEPDPMRGRGMAIARTLAQDVDVETGSSGTTVTLRFDLASTRPAPATI